MEIKGNKRVEGVVIAEVDPATKKPIAGTEKLYECDTLLLSCGLIPENELSKAADVRLNRITGGPEVNQFMQTNRPSVFACGNTVHVNDLADNVSEESERAGKYAAMYANGTLPTGKEIPTVPKNNVRYICPQRINPNEAATLFFRAAAPQKNVTVKVWAGEREILSKKLIKINPGEMEKVEVKPEQIAGAEAVTIEVI